MEDRRVTKTKAAIEHAFEGLVQEVDYEKITVSAIAERANINRKTFYLHYSSVEDVLNALTERHAKGAMEAIAKQGMLEEDPINIDKIVAAIGEHYREARLLNPIFMRRFPAPAICKALRPTWVAMIQYERSNRGLPPLENAEYYADFMLGGMLITYQTWYNDCNDVQFDTIAKIVVTSVLYGAEEILSQENPSK